MALFGIKYLKKFMKPIAEIGPLPEFFEVFKKGVTLSFKIF